MGISSVELQQTPSGIDSIRYIANYGSQKVLLSASGNLTSAVTATSFNVPAASSVLAGLSGDMRGAANRAQMVGTTCLAWPQTGLMLHRIMYMLTAFAEGSSSNSSSGESATLPLFAIFWLEAAFLAPDIN
jgi:hypothetical protein